MSAKENLPDGEVLKLIDYPSFFDLLGIELPANRDRIMARLEKERLISRADNGNWNILNKGEVLFAKDLSGFPKLHRKALRVIHYQGNNRVETLHEQVSNKGYAYGFEGLIAYINGRIPHNEVLGTAFRKDIPMFPEVAIRELVANALVTKTFSSKAQAQ